MKYAALAAAAMMATPALADVPCKKEATLPMITEVSGLSPQILVGIITTSIDEAKHNLCIRMEPNPLLGNKIINGRGCVDVNDPKAKGLSPVMQFANGTKVPMLPFTPEIAKNEYAVAMESCKAAANPAPAAPPAKAPFVVPPSNWRYEI